MFRKLFYNISKTYSISYKTLMKQCFNNCYVLSFLKYKYKNYKPSSYKILMYNYDLKIYFNIICVNDIDDSLFRFMDLINIFLEKQKEYQELKKFKKSILITPLPSPVIPEVKYFRKLKGYC